MFYMDENADIWHQKRVFFFSIHQHSMPFRVLILAWEEEEEEWKQKKQVAVLQ